MLFTIGAVSFAVPEVAALVALDCEVAALLRLKVASSVVAGWCPSSFIST